MITLRKTVKNSLLLALLLIPSIAQPMELPLNQNNVSQTIRLISADDENAQEIEISRDAVQHAGAIKLMFDDLGADNSNEPILIKTSTKMLLHVVRCLNIIETIKNQAQVGNSLENYVAENLFLSDKIDLLDVANYLDIKPLLYACVEALTKELYLDNIKLRTSLNQDIDRLCVQHGKIFKPVQDWVQNQYVQYNFKYTDHLYPITSVCFSPNGKLLASLSDERMNIWDIDQGKVRKCYKPTVPVKLMSFHATDNDIISSVANTLFTTTNIHADTHNTRNIDINILQNQLILFLHSPEENGLIFRTITVPSIVSEPTRYCFIDKLSCDSKIIPFSTGNRIMLYNSSTKSTITFEGHSGIVNSVCFSPNGKLLASASDDKTIKIWDVSTHQCICTLQGHTDSVRSVCFSPDGKRLASGSADKSIIIWDLDLRQQTKEVFTNKLTLEQTIFLTRVYQSNAKGDTFRITEDNQNIYSSLPDFLQNILIKRVLIYIPSDPCANVEENPPTTSQSCTIQ